MPTQFTKSDTPALLLGVMALLALAGAYMGEFVLGLKPCVLCLYERYIYWGVFGLAMIAFVLPQRQIHLGILTLITLAALGQLGLSVYHVAVEQGVVAPPSMCLASEIKVGSLSLDDLRGEILATERVACNKVPWSLVGISLAGFNALYALTMTTLGTWFLFARRRNRND